MLCFENRLTAQLQQQLRSQINGAKPACLMLLLFMVHQDVAFGLTVTIIEGWHTDFSMQGHSGNPQTCCIVIWYLILGLLRSKEVTSNKVSPDCLVLRCVSFHPVRLMAGPE